MSMSTHIIGFKPPNEKWKQMKAVWDACETAKTPIPQEVLNFFNHEPPDDDGVEINLETHPCCEEYDEDMSEGFQIEIDKLPKDIKIIRFVNSY